MGKYCQEYSIKSWLNQNLYSTSFRVGYQTVTFDGKIKKRITIFCVYIYIYIYIYIYMCVCVCVRRMSGTYSTIFHILRTSSMGWMQQQVRKRLYYIWVNRHSPVGLLKWEWGTIESDCVLCECYIHINWMSNYLFLCNIFWQSTEFSLIFHGTNMDFFLESKIPN